MVVIRYQVFGLSVAKEIVYSTRNLAIYDVNTASFLEVLCCCGLIFGFGLPF